MRRRVLTIAFLGTVLASALLGASSASALEIRTFSAKPSVTQAGGHPDLTVTYAGESRFTPVLEAPCHCNDAKDVDVSLPAGFIGNPHATPRCKAADFARNACPADSQVGVITAYVNYGFGLVAVVSNEPVYNSIPRPNQAGLLSAVVGSGLFNIPLFTSLEGRTDSDYGLNANTEGIQRTFALQKFTYTIWGVPADDVHTPMRYVFDSEGFLEGTVPSNSPHVPFLINPVTCNTSDHSSLKLIGYDGSEETATDSWPTSTGCDQLSFNPSLSAQPTTTATDSASGIDADLTVPQILSPTFPSPSPIKSASVTLPVGYSINPNAADGKVACTDAQANFGTTEEAHCPEFSKIGTDVVDSPALPAPIEGGIYLGEPKPGSRYRIFLTADGFATHVKLAGVVKLDPQTGQVVNVFDNLPQAPLSEFKLHFFGAERGVLSTPTQCGQYAVQSTFTAWDEAVSSQSATQFFNLETGPGGVPCPTPTRDFNPVFQAGSVYNTAGSHSPFAIDLTRNDGEQNLSGLTVTTPPGFSATLAGIPYCSDAALAATESASYLGVSEQLASACPEASLIGTSVAGAGAGSRPVYLPGKVYLAGPYKGAPLSLAIVTPAVSGPYDLGNVVVRTALKVDPLDAHVTAVSDPFPRLVDGILLRIRKIRVSLDRKGFTLNPTSCDPLQVSAAILGDQNGVKDVNVPFQVANCAILPYQPKLKLKLTGGLNRLGHPAIHSVITAGPGEANTREVQVTLPRGELLDNSHLGNICTRVDFAKEACPPDSAIGHAVVTTPVLDQPLVGSAYLRSSSHGLPDLALQLNGQVDLEAIGQVDSVNERYRATFKTVPDVPFSKIVLNLSGGSKGLLQNSEPLCGRNRSATARMVGQNGAVFNTRTKLELACGSKGRHKRHLSRAKEVR
jgi:hypothetical protein